MAYNQKLSPCFLPRLLLSLFRIRTCNRGNRNSEECRSREVKWQKQLWTPTASYIPSYAGSSSHIFILQ